MLLENESDMKHKPLFSLFFFTALLVSGQTKDWETELSEDGNTKVVYSIYDSLNAQGEEVKFIEYNSKTTTTASVEKCTEIFNNPELHQKIYEYTEKSEKIKDISVNEWIIYYYYSPPWPIADSDCVSRITQSTDTLNNSITFTSFSEPDLLELKDVARSELNDITFTFTQLGEGKTEIKISAILIPVTSAPSWMMSGWFPEGPAGILNRFKELAEN